MAPFRDCFTASEVVGAIVDRGDVEPLIGGAVPFYQRAKDPEFGGLWARPPHVQKAEQRPCGRGRDGDPNSAEAATAPEPTGVDLSDDGRDCYPAESRGRRYRVGRIGGRQ